MRFSRTTAAFLSSFAFSHGLTIIPGGDPKPYRGPSGVLTADRFYRESAENEFVNNTAEILMSSYDDTFNGLGQVLPSSESFVRGAIQAWGEHLHLVLRPDEVWFTILGQMNFYMNSHPDEISSIFATHRPDPMYLEDYEFYRVIQGFVSELERHAKASWFMDWAFPNFTTSTRSDAMTATVLMLGIVKPSLRVDQRIACGIPSVTLLGEQLDWEILKSKLDRFAAFGPEAAAYRARLAPILSRFVASFAAPDSAETTRFWSQIVSASPSPTCGGQPYSLSGWITGFFYWGDSGKPFARGTGPLVIDNISFPSVDIRELPVGYARAPFLLRDYNNTAIYQAEILGGTLGKQITEGPPDGYAEALQRSNASATSLPVTSSSHSSLQPLSAWTLYGPVDHNATAQKWVAEDELVDLASALRSTFNDTQCGHKSA